MISEESVGQILQHLFDLCDQYKISATFFELTTLLAFEYFAQSAVDVAVIETGIGGRLDATNILYPTLSVITSISTDHTETLGDTIEAIAKEKAGIIKQGVPVIIGPRVPFNHVEPIARACNAPCFQVTGAFENYDEENSHIARKVLEYLEVPSDAIEEGIKALPKCRVELHSSIKHPDIPLIFDVAHNPDGLQHLFSAVKKRYPTQFLRVICGLSKNKDVAACTKIVAENADFIHVVESTNGRGLPSKELQQHLIERGVNENKVKAALSIKESIEEALSLSASSPTVIVVCGTFFIMAEARAALDIKDPSDPIELNESLRIFPSIVKLKL
jgi:dihydrofolate synthase/folylpolyglutamate synthase